jgi:two-component system OmpR family sensor kinase
MAVMLAIIGVFQYFIMREFIYQNKAASIQNQIMSISPGAWEKIVRNINTDNNPFNNAFQGSQNGNFIREQERLPYFIMPDSTIVFVDTEGNYNIIVNSTMENRTPPQLTLAEYENIPQAKHGLSYRIVNEGTDSEDIVVLQTIFDKDQRIGTVQVSMGTKPLKVILYRILFAFLSLSLLALIAGVLAFIPVLRKTLVPLTNMAETVEQINSGNLAERFPVEQGQIEIDQLADSFNRMLERLELSFAAEQEAKEQMRRFVADASHELRTPLTSIHGFLEVLLRGAVNQPDKLEKSLKSMLTESERMKKLIQDLLQLAKLDRSPEIELKESELDILVKEMEPQLKMLAGIRKVNIDIAPGLKCKVDEDKIKQVILNLFQNAVQHTETKNGYIELRLSDVSNGIEIAVKDNGAGISDEHIPYLFDRFYRCDSSRTRKHGGSGLGLSITKSIIEAHNGVIRVDSVEGGGSTFTVWLPK